MSQDFEIDLDDLFEDEPAAPATPPVTRSAEKVRELSAEDLGMASPPAARSHHKKPEVAPTAKSPAVNGAVLPEPKALGEVVTDPVWGPVLERLDRIQDALDSIRESVGLRSAQRQASPPPEIKGENLLEVFEEEDEPAPTPRRRGRPKR